MLRKMLVLTVAASVATLLMSADVLAWGCGGWSRSGSVSYTGRYVNTYSRSYGGDTSRILGWTAYVNGLLGRKRKASNIAGELEELARGQYVCPVDLARSYVGIGNKDRALARLHQAADLHCGRLIWTGIDPSFASVWTDERFSAIRSRMNL